MWWRLLAAIVITRRPSVRSVVQSVPMSDAASSDQEQRERQVRLMIIIGLAAVVLIAGLAVSILGSRQVNDEVDDLRQAASAASVDPDLIALTAYGMDSDPVLASSAGRRSGGLASATGRQSLVRRDRGLGVAQFGDCVLRDRRRWSVRRDFGLSLIAVRDEQSVTSRLGRTAALSMAMRT